MTEFLAYAVLVALSAALTGVIRGYALKSGLLDRPNERSSHEVPTPRGGGLAIVLTFTGTIVFLFVYAEFPLSLLVALAAGGSLVSTVGFLDDHGHVPALVRFAIHTIAAVAAVLLIAPDVPLQFGDTVLRSGIVGQVLCVVAIAWSINLFNFMDGIDAIAGAEAVFICFAAVFIATTISTTSAPVDSACLGLGAACLGFLLWNWPPARIFMGDVGSGFVGFAVAVLAVASVADGVLPIWTWLILVGTFFVDSTYTLLRRAAAGARWYEAHRSHAYQRASRRFRSHARVTLTMSGINVCWLLPLAWLAAYRPEWGAWLLLVAWLPLVAICRAIGAGRMDDE